jgi:pyruvate/2-oxoglutarate/acetoin dehydrogenase E1 component
LNLDKKYIDYLSESMNLAAQRDNVIFCGQAVAVDGTAIRGTLLEVPEQKLIEFPVDEDFQMGFCTGLAYGNFLPICIFPRWNFLLLATNQIVNYLDKIKELTNLFIPPKVIIRTSIGSISPMHPGIQHIGDYTEAFRLLLKNIHIEKLEDKHQIIPAYERALSRNDGVSSLLIEDANLYST